ncbi:HEAT repeat domain-containing protein [Sphingosinicella sp.]|uniref:HEAT repeat domain-containing protein n=1 Tax=Sphingosinicella sp. TaxID=1917971 RepID=UPI0040384144
MIPSPALAAWLADPQAQQASYARVLESAAKWGLDPLMTQLERKLSELDAPTPDAILALADDFMDNTATHARLFDDMIAGCRADPFFRPPFYPLSGDIHSALLLFNNPLLSIALGVTGVDQLAAKKLAHGGKGSIAFSGLVTKFRYLKAGGATLSFWEADAIGSDFVAAQAGTARFVGQRRLEDGEEILIDGRRESFVIEHACADMVYLQAMVRTGGAPVTAEYSRETLGFLSASSTDEVSSRIQMMVSLLRAMDREDALPLMEKELESPRFYTRWHVMREMLALDAEAALPALKRMAAGDPHPEVRAAAASTLATFFPDEQAAACPA